MIRINLLPLRAERKKEDAKRMVTVFALAVSLAVLMMGWWYVSGMRKVSRLEGQLASNEAEIARYTKLAEQIKTLQEQKTALEAKLNVIKTLEKSKTGPVHVLDELASRLPVQRLWLTGLDQRAQTLTVKGQALDNESIAIYMRRLGGSDYIASVDLLSVEQKEREGVRLMDFALTCQLRLTGMPEAVSPHSASPQQARRIAQR